MEELLINSGMRETRAVILVDGVLEDIWIERRTSKGLVGNIYKGRVIRVLPGMQSAFIDIGLERSGFLHVADIEAAHGEDGVKPIEKVLTEGMSLLVQVAKDPIGTKGARLTTTISLAGRKLVYLPHDHHIGVSQRIEDETLREALRERVTLLRPESEKGGYIIRTSAEEGATDEEFQQDMAYLGRLWMEIENKVTHQGAPSVLYTELSLGQRMLRDKVSAVTEKILVDNRDTFEELKRFAERFVPGAAEKLELFKAERPLFEARGVDAEIEKALCRRVDLKSGGYLVVDQTEAMTTIDVNTGGFVGRRDFSETVFKTNLEAAQVIARQLRLRNLGGIIIIDFIDMASTEHQRAVLAELRRACESDRTKHTISEFTELGLVEMTRKRTRESLSHVLCETCPVCAGRGLVKTARTVCYDILREIVREYKQYRDAQEFKVLASQSVIDLFLEDEADALNILQDTMGKRVILEVESCYTQERFDVILL